MSCKAMPAGIGLCPMATASLWRNKVRTEFLINQLRTDAYEDNPTQLQNEGFVPQLVVRRSQPNLVAWSRDDKGSKTDMKDTILPLHFL